MEVLSVGKRLKNIRKELKIRQDEITGNQITRNLISIIENDKAALTPKVAEILAYEINSIALKKGIDFNITAEELMEPVEKQLEKYAMDWKKSIDDGLLDLSEKTNELKIRNFENQLISHKLFDAAFNINVSCEKFFKKRGEIRTAYEYAFKANGKVPLILPDSRVSGLFINLGYYCIGLEKYSEAIFYSDFAMEKFQNLDINSRYKLQVNKSIALNNMGLFKESYDIIENLLQIKGFEAYRYDDLLAHKANLLIHMKSYQESLEIFNKLYDNMKSDEKKYFILANKLDINIKIGNKEDIYSTMNDSFLLLNKESNIVESRYLAYLYFNLSSGYKIFNNESLYLQYVDKSILLAINLKLIKELKIFFSDKLEYVIDSKNVVLMENIILEMEGYLDSGVIEFDDKIINTFMLLLSSFSLYDKLDNLIKRIHEEYKK